MDEEFNFDINFDFLSESKVTPRDSTPQCRQQNTTFTTESLALRIASVNDLVIQIKNLNEHNLKLQMEVESLSGTAASIKLLYEQEKAINSERELHIEELNQKLEEAKDQLANKLLHCEQISSYMEENKGLVPYNELALRYYRVANKVEETMGLGLKEKTILKEIQNHIESKKLTVLQPLKRKRLKNYKDTAVQCKLPIKSQSIGIQHAVGMMCKSTSTDSEGLNLKSSVEQSTQTLPEDRLKYMVSKGIQYRYSTTTRATNTTNLVTTRSIGTSNTDLTLIDVADILDEMEFTHSPLSPIPISIYDNPMEEKVHTNSIGTNTDLYNVQKPIDYLFERSEPEKPRLPSKSLCSCVKSEMPPFATQCLMHPNNLNSIDFVYTFCRYMLLAMQNNSDLSNPVRKYYGSKKDEKQEENLDTMENTKDYFKPSSPCDPSSNGYLPINENAGNNSKNEMQYDNLINSSPVFLQPQSFENNDIERFFPAENNATFFDNNNYVPEDPLIGSDSVQTSRVDKILRLFPEYTSSKGKRKEIKRILKTSTTKKTRKNNSHSIFEISNDENVFGPYQISLGNEGIPKNPSTQFNNSNKTFENVVLRKETPDISSNTASLEKTHKSNGTLERVFLKKKAAETSTNNTPQLEEPHQNNEYRRKDFKSEQRTEMGELSPTEKSDSVLNNSHVGVTSRIKAKDKYVKNSNYSNSKTLDLHESSPKEKDQRIEHLEATEETSMSPHHIAVTINGNPVQISENTNIVPSNTIKDASTERKTTASPDLDKRQQVGIFKGFGNHKHKIENVDEEEELLFPQNKVSTDIAMQPISHNTSDKNPEYSQMDMAMSLPNEDTFTDNMSKYRASDSVEQGGRSPKDTRKSVPKMTAQQDLNTIQQDEFSRSMRRNVLEDVLNKNDQEINEFARSTASESNCLNGVSPLNCYNLENEKRRNVVDASFSDSFEKSKSTHFDFERTTSETKYQNNCVPVKVAKGEVHLCSSIKSADVRDEPSDGYVQSRSNKDQHFKCLQRSVSHVTENNCCLEREHTFEYTKCKSNRENSLSRYPSAEGKTQSYCPAKKGMDTLISASDEDSNSSEKSLPSETQNMKKFTQPFEFSPKDISDCEFQENEDIFMYKKSTFSLPGTKLLMKASSPVTRINALTFQTLDSKESSICNFSESNFTTKSVISLEIPGDGSEYSSIPPDKSKKSNVTLRDSSQQQHFEPESRNLSKALSIDNPKTLKRKEKRIARIKKLKRRKDSCSENEQHNLVFAEKVTRINNSTKKTSDRDVKNAAVIKSIHSSTSSEEDSNQTAYTPCETGFNGELGELGQEEAQKGMKQAMFSPKVYDINISFKNTPVELEQEEAQHELERVMVPRTSFDKSRPSKRVLEKQNQEEAPREVEQAMISPKCFDIARTFKGRLNELEQKEDVRRGMEQTMLPPKSFDKNIPFKSVLEKENQEEAQHKMEQAMMSPKGFDIARTFKGRPKELEQKEDVHHEMEQTMLPPKSFDKNIPFKSVLEKGNQEEAQHEMKQAMMSPKGFDKNIPSKSVLEKQIQEEAQHEIELNMISPKSFDIDRTLKGALGEREQEKVLGKLNQEKPYLEIELPMFSPKGIDKDRTLKGALRGQEQEEVLGKLNQEKPHLEIEQRMFTPNGIDKQRAFTSALRELKQMEQAMLSPRSFDINRTFKVTLRKSEQEGADYEMEQPMMLSKVCDINRSFKKTPVELEQENTQHEIERVMVSPNSFDKSRPSKRVLEKHNQKEAHHEMEQSMMSQKGYDIARTIKSRLKELEQKGDVHHEMERSVLLPKGFDKNIKFKSVLEEENQEETQHEMEQDMISKKGLDIARTFKGRLKELEQKEDVHHEMERSLLPPKNFNKNIPFKGVLEKGNQEEAHHEMEQSMMSPKGFDIARTIKSRLKELEQKGDVHHEMERSMLLPKGFDKNIKFKSVLEEENQEETQHEMEQDMISKKGLDIARTFKGRLKELEQKEDVHHEMERSLLPPKNFNKYIPFKSVLEKGNQEEAQHEMEQDMISPKGFDIARTFKGRLKDLEQKEDVHHEMERSMLPPKNFDKNTPFKSVLVKGNQEEAQHEMEQDMISPKGFDIARTFKGRLKELEQKEDAHHEMERSMFSSNSLDKSRPSKSVLEKQNQEEVQHEMEQDMISPKGFDIAGTFKGRLKELEQKEDVHHEMERSMLLPKNVNKNIPFKSVLEKENQVEAQHKMEQAMMSQNGFKINRKFKGSLEQEGVQHEIEQVMFSSNSLSKSRPTKSVLEKQNQQEVQHEMEQDMISPKGFDIDRTLKVALEKLNQEKPPLEVEQHMFSPKGIDIDRTLKGALGEREQGELLGKLNQEKPPLEVEQRMFSPKGIDKQRTFTSALRELKQQEVQQKMEQAMFSPRNLDKNKQFKSVPEKHSQETSHQKIDQALLSPRPFDINRTFRGTLGKIEQKEAQLEMERIMVSPKDFENTPCQMVPFSKKSEINYSTYADDPVQEVVNCTRKIDKRINLESYTRYDALITGALIKTSYTSQISQIKGSSKYFTGSTEAVLNEMSNESDGAQTLKQINTKVVEDPESRCLNKCIVSPKKSCPVESIIIKPTISSEVDLSKRFDKVDQNDFQHSTTCLKTNSMCSLESKSVVNTTLPIETLSSSIYHPKFGTHSNVGVSELSNTTGLYVVEQNISTTNASPEHCSSKFTPHKPDQWSNLSLQMNNSSNHYNFSSSSQFSSESESDDQDLEHLDIDSLLEQILEEYNLPSPVSEINDIDEVPHSPDAPKIPKDTKEDAKEKTYPSSNIQPTRSSLRLAAAKQDKLKKYQEEESTNSHLESEIKLPHIKERCNKPHLFNNKKRKSSSPDEITTKRKNSLLQNDLIVPEVQLKALGVELGKYTTLSSGECRKQDKMTKDTNGPSSTKDSYEPDIRLGFFKDSLEGESANEISSDSNLLVTGCKSSKPSFWDELVKQPEEIENTTRVTDTNVLTLSSPQLEHNPAAQETFSLCPFETKESNYAKSNILSSDGSYLAFSESPSSPPLIDQKPEDTHVIRKYFDVPLNFVRSPYKSILSEMIGNHYPDKVNQTTESNSSIIQSLKTVINEYLKEVPEKRNINTTFDNILKVTKIWKCIALGVVHTAVDISRGNSDIPGYYRGPNLDYGLCGLVSLVILLNAKQSKFRQMVLLALDHHLFKLKSEAMSLGSLLNLTQLYLALIANPELGSSPVRLFLCKCLYFYNLKAIPMVNEILEVYPTVLPIWKSLDDRSDALITTIQYILMNTYYDLEKEDLKTRSLYIKLVQKYKYQTLQPTREQVIEHLIAKIRAGCFNNVSYAFAMIGKRIKQQIAEETLLKHLLVPLAQKYYDTMTLTPDNDSRIACVLECISFIIKPFGLNSNMSTYLNLFERFLNACDRQLVQEAALAGIIRLTRFGFVKCFTAAYKFAPNYDLSENMKKMLLSFIYKKNHKFLQNLQRQCEVLDVK